MKRIRNPVGQAGFTFMDFLILLTVIAILTILTLPNISRRGNRGQRVQCVYNLKQIGLAFRMWATDHEEQFPMAVPSDKGGAKEFALAGQPLPSFRVMDRELRTPRVLYCGEDKKRERTDEFAALTEKNLSYLVGVDASDIQPQMVLTADRNITINGIQVSRGLVILAGTNRLGWSSTMHEQQGNIGLADGSVAQATIRTLQQQSEKSALRTNRFAVP
jgi:competence protein ComGC